MTYTGKYHGHVVIVAIVYAQLVFDRSTGLDNSLYTSLVGNLHTIREGEEGVTGHYGSIQVEVERSGLFYSLS